MGANKKITKREKYRMVIRLVGEGSKKEKAYLGDVIWKNNLYICKNHKSVKMGIVAKLLNWLLQIDEKSQKTKQSNAEMTPFPDRHKLINWQIDKLEQAISNGDVNLVNKLYAGLIELVRQQNINKKGELDDYLKTIRKEYDEFRMKYNLEYPQESLPPNERKNTTNTIKRGNTILSEEEKMKIHSSNMREATRLKENGQIKEAIELIQKSQKQTGFTDPSKLASYLLINNEPEAAVEVLRNTLEKKIPYYNNPWLQISSIYYRSKNYERYLYAMTMFIFFEVIYGMPMHWDKNVVKAFYKEQSVEFLNITNVSRFMKIMQRPDFLEKYNAVLMPFFNEIKTEILQYTRYREDDKFTEQELQFFNRYSLTFFEKFYNDNVKKNCV